MSFVDAKTIEPSGVEPAPFTYTLSSAEAIGPQSMSVTFDGSGAAGNFLACVDFLAPDGTLIARCPADASVTAGDVAEVTFAPFLRTASSGTGGGGIQFDTDNVGDWLKIETTSFDPSNIPQGIFLHGNGAASGIKLLTENQPIQITSLGGITHGGIEILNQGDHLSIIMDSASASPVVIDTMQRQEIDIASSNSQSGNVNICGDPTFVGNSLSFFQSGGVGQQTLPAVPTTAQIRAVLVAFGLVAP